VARSTTRRIDEGRSTRQRTTAFELAVGSFGTRALRRSERREHEQS